MQKKTEIITAKMTPADKKVIHQRTRAAGMTVTDYLTICALGKEIVRVDGLDEVLSELNAQGRNLNQLTTLANMGRITVLRGDDLVQEYSRLCDALGALIRVDTGHLHNYMVVNSVSHKDGHKLHQSPSDLLTHQKVNDEICLAHGLRVLDECELRTKKKRMKPGEYQAGLRGDSWKLDLIQAINKALEYATSRESFIENMEVEGYEASWSDTRKHIIFTCPNGRKCRDSSLHGETFLKENLEALLPYVRRCAEMRIAPLSTKKSHMARRKNMCLF